jgi:RNA polymerase sigma factor (sigma-70 family)
VGDCEERFEQSERERFEGDYRRCYEAVHRYAARRVAAEAVQDVVADTFLTAWRRYGELSGEPLPWLLGIARRTAANHRRGGARRDALRERLMGERSSHAAVATAERDTLTSELGGDDPRVLLALAALGERDREALMLVAWDGLEYRVAAGVMGCSTGAFTVRVHRARRKLERALAGERRSPLDVIQEARSLQ